MVRRVAHFVWILVLVLVASPMILQGLFIIVVVGTVTLAAYLVYHAIRVLRGW